MAGNGHFPVTDSIPAHRWRRKGRGGTSHSATLDVLQTAMVKGQEEDARLGGGSGLSQEPDWGWGPDRIVSGSPSQVDPGRLLGMETPRQTECLATQTA